MPPARCPTMGAVPKEVRGMSRYCIHEGSAEAVAKAVPMIRKELRHVDKLFKSKPRVRPSDKPGMAEVAFEAPSSVHYGLCPSLGLMLVEDLS